MNSKSSGCKQDDYCGFPQEKRDGKKTRLSCDSMLNLISHRFLRVNFSLVELLIVIAIITILAAILLPALNRAMEQAKRSHCKNNMKQIGMAIFMYTDDNREHYFMIRNNVSTVTSSGTFWYRLDATDAAMAPYLKARNVFMCKARENQWYKYVSYAANRSIFAYTNFNWSKFSNGLTVRQVVAPSKKIFLTEITGKKYVSGSYAGNMVDVSYGFDQSWYEKIANFHSGGMNVLHADGRVLWKKQIMLWNAANSSIYTSLLYPESAELNNY